MIPSPTLVRLALATALALPLTGYAQRVTATLGEVDTVRQGTRLALAFGFEDVAPGDFALPELVGLRALGAPSRRSQVSIVNGERSSAAILTYPVVADQTGLAYVPAVAVPVTDGDTLHTEPLQLFVTADSTYVPPPPESELTPAPRRPRPPVIKM